MNIFQASIGHSVQYVDLNNSIIVCDGNSLTAGGWPTNLSTLLSNMGYVGFTVHNKGVGGQTTAQMEADAVSDIDSLYDGNKTCILVAWEVGNDIYFNGNVSSAITNITTYCTNRKAVGWKVVLVGLPDRIQTTAFGDNPTQYKAKLVEADNIMRDTFISIGADAFVDLIADPRLQDATDLTYYNADQVHLVSAGNLAVAENVLDSLIFLEQ